MNCNIIKDLLPLYIDQCCSEESKALVHTHLEGCQSCRNEYQKMQKSWSHTPVEVAKVTMRPLRIWGASVLQAVMLFLSFGLLAVGVFLEGNTPSGATNGLWAVALIVPASAYLLSMGNWFFVRSYQNSKRFSNGSFVMNLMLTLSGYGWAVFHYTDGIAVDTVHLWAGIALSVVLCALSKVLSVQYARFLGRE